jgi:hypothetical protein
MKMRNFELPGELLADWLLQMHRRIWQHLPAGMQETPLLRYYGRRIHARVCLRAQRRQYLGTFFLRNRPALELMRRIGSVSHVGRLENVGIGTMR